MPPSSLLVSMDMGSLASFIHPFNGIAADLHFYPLMF
jgi:hypothetical protein